MMVWVWCLSVCFSLCLLLGCGLRVLWFCWFTWLLVCLFALVFGVMGGRNFAEIAVFRILGGCLVCS